ncbi:NUDIX hydrolase [Sulfurimonas aquatica]|uniref:NUDIX hydrolase n=1 Tax=Sulfurimonas aquatica TaxID=2672570 RepID=A0A975AYE9_9BACT|nr:NUDIX hydrolase [Sulfurimonas aquatica]QSZ40891.1 NUDIX hydrolase [Sulfurimonas aquatica]
MDKINKISILKEPNFVKPIEITYTHKGVQRIWEAVVTHDSVAILLWHKEKDSFVIVKQLRPPIFNANPSDGYMHELCAGIVDKEISKIEIAREEVLEECGFDVPLKKMQRVTSFYTSVGISGAKQTLYYAQIDESMKLNDGGGLMEEDIEVIYLSTSKAREFLFDESYQKTPGMMMAFYWFFENIKN